MNQPDQTIRLDSQSVQQTVDIAAAVGRSAKTGDLIGLVGELGAGKTQFVRGLAQGLGIEPRKVSSPTFVFLHEYMAGENDRDALVLAHIDAYRLAGEGDLASIGWEGHGEELRTGAVLAVEWADRIHDAMGSHWLKVLLEHTDTGRVITLTPHGNWRDRMTTLRARLDPLVPQDKV